MKRADDILGLEYDWLAADGADHVALFSTAGGSYAPPAFLDDVEAHELAIAALLALPPSTTTRLAADMPDDAVGTWRRVAERGVFAFDGDVHGGPYRLVAAPRTPVRVAELPPPIAVVLQRVRFPELRFADLVEATEALLSRRGP